MDGFCGAVYGISRKTGYKWLRGIVRGKVRRVLLDRSTWQLFPGAGTRSGRRGGQSVELRGRYPFWGRASLKAHLERERGVVDCVLAASSIGDLLGAAELGAESSAAADGGRPVLQPFTEARGPNDVVVPRISGLASVTRNGARCDPLGRSATRLAVF